MSTHPEPSNTAKISTPTLAKYVEPLPVSSDFLPGKSGAWLGHTRGDDHAPTDNDAWESLLRTNANLGREVSEKTAQLRELTANYESIIRVCQQLGYDRKRPVVEWLESVIDP